MAETYGNPHTLAPTICAANIPSWTDSTLTANSTKPRAVHINELRTEIDNELTRRGLGNMSWGSPSTVIANSTKIRKLHLDYLRTAMVKIKTGDCSGDGSYCPQDASSAMTWTDTTINVNVTKVRAVHFSEIRTKLQELMVTCICEAEQCQYCADCGYRYSVCSHHAVACDDDCGADGCGHTTWYNICASVDLAAATDHPYKSASGNPLITSAWDNTVPWVMCNDGSNPPGVDWDTYTTAQDHTAWNCKCNPYTWLNTA